MQNINQTALAAIKQLEYELTQTARNFESKHGLIIKRIDTRLALDKDRKIFVVPAVLINNNPV